jgi:hypothetical protein
MPEDPRPVLGARLAVIVGGVVLTLAWPRHYLAVSDVGALVEDAGRALAKFLKTEAARLPIDFFELYDSNIPRPFTCGATMPYISATEAKQNLAVVLGAAQQRLRS